MSSSYKELNTQVRKYRRLYRAFLWMFCLVSAFGVAQTFDKAAIREDYKDTVAAYRAAVYGLTYALSEEQAKAGGFEAEAIDSEQDLAQKRGEAWRLRQRVALLEMELQECRAEPPTASGTSLEER